MKSNFPAIDAYCNGVFLQMTVSLDHGIKMEAFVKELKEMNWPNDAPVIIIFVVPSAIFDAFGLQKVDKEDLATEYKLTQYVLKLEESSLTKAFEEIGKTMLDQEKKVGPLFSAVFSADPSVRVVDFSNDSNEVKSSEGEDSNLLNVKPLLFYDNEEDRKAVVEAFKSIESVIKPSTSGNNQGPSTNVHRKRSASGASTLDMTRKLKVRRMEEAGRVKEDAGMEDGNGNED